MKKVQLNLAMEGDTSNKRKQKGKKVFKRKVKKDKKRDSLDGDVIEAGLGKFQFSSANFTSHQKVKIDLSESNCFIERKLSLCIRFFENRSVRIIRTERS